VIEQVLGEKYLEKNYKVVKEIKTPQCVLIPFCFTGKPIYCSSWERDELEHEFKKMSINKNFSEEHWDLFPATFLFDKDNNGVCGRVSLLKPLKRREPNDICIEVSPKLTWVFRPTPSEILSSQKGYHVNHFLAGTHNPDQLSIYKSPEAWGLHLILKEYQKKEKACIILDETYWYTYSNKSQECRDKFPYLYLYEALYAYFRLA
jgi:hypothetical protein